MFGRAVDHNQTPTASRNKRIVLIVAAAVAVATIAVPVVWWWWQSSEVQAALAAIRARGEPVTPDELYANSPRIPPDKDCFALYQADERTWMKAYRDKLRLLRQFDSDQQLPELAGEWEALPIAEQLLLDCREDFARWHQAAALGGRANFPMHAEEGYGGSVPWVSPLRGIVRCLLLEGYLRARHGDATGATDSLCDALTIAQSLASNPLAVSQLVRMSNQRAFVRNLKHLLPQVNFSAQDLERLQVALAVVDIRPGLQLGLLGDRVAGIVSADDPTTMGYNLRIGGNLTTAIHYATKQQLAVRYLDAMRRLIDVAAQPWPVVVAQTEDVKHPTYPPRRSTFDFDLLPEFLGHLVQYVREGARTTAANQVGILALALARYRLDQGRFPEQLSDLAPSYITEVPLDATSGEPFVYKLDDRGLLLHSKWHDVNSKIDAETGADQELLFRWPIDGK
jgi:hypothetical protein